MNAHMNKDNTMAENTKYGSGRRWSPLRIARWVAPALLLPVPLVAMQVSDEWNWTLFGFVFIGTVLYGAVLTYELVARKADTTAYRAAVGVAVVTAVLLVWVNGAVGIIGDGPVNLKVFRAARDRNHRCLHREPGTAWNGALAVRDGARSNVGPRNRAGDLEPTVRPRSAASFCFERVLRRAVVRIGSAVPESGTRGTRTARGITTAARG